MKKHTHSNSNVTDIAKLCTNSCREIKSDLKEDLSQSEANCEKMPALRPPLWTAVSICSQEIT